MFEKFNSTLETILTMTIDSHQTDRDCYISKFMFVLLSIRQLGILFSKELIFSVIPMFGQPADHALATKDHICFLQEHPQEARRAVCKKTRFESDWMKTRHNRKNKSEEFQEGDLIWLCNVS